MKLLFDQNLSPFPVSRLADIFPDSAHVRVHAGDMANLLTDDTARFLIPF